MALDHLGTPQAPTFGLAPLADLDRQALADHGHDPLPISMHSPGHGAEPDELQESA
jgi:hypothetical protein